MFPRLRLGPNPWHSAKSLFSTRFSNHHTQIPFARCFRASSPLRQRYEYVRFNDPFPQPGGNPGGKPGGGRWSEWQRLWHRFTPGQRLLLIGVGGGAPIFYVSHLETVDITGRRRFIFMSRSMEEALGKMVNSPESNPFPFKT